MGPLPKLKYRQPAQKGHFVVYTTNRKRFVGPRPSSDLCYNCLVGGIQETDSRENRYPPFATECMYVFYEALKMKEPPK
jgi:hypothetical protein